MSATRAATLLKCALLVCGLVLASTALHIAKTYGDMPVTFAP